MNKIVKTTVMVMLGLGGHSILAQNTVPTVVCPAPVTVECAPATGAPLNLSVNVSDPQSNAVTLVWFVDGMAFQTNDLAAGTTGTPGVAVPFNGLFGSGAHDVRVVASDGELLAECTTTVTVAENAAPVVTNITANPSVLWPPNHKMRPIRLNVGATDECGGSITSRVVSVTSNEPLRGTGPLDKGPDWVIGQGGRTLSLRAERSGQMRAGRIYTITVETMDAGGNSTNNTVTVTVPHDRGQGPFAGTPKKAKKPKKPKRR